MKLLFVSLFQIYGNRIIILSRQSRKSPHPSAPLSMNGEGVGGEAQKTRVLRLPQGIYIRYRLQAWANMVKTPE